MSEPYYQDERVTLYGGDALAVLASLPTGSVDAVVCARWFAQVDGCPMCVYNVEAPRSVEPRGDGFRAHYECRDCGHRWFTGWADE